MSMRDEYERGKALANVLTDQDVLNRVVDYVVAMCHDLHLPGLALAIVQDDQVIYQHGFGVADTTSRPVTPQTPFIIGSLSKSFTALAIMQLVESGKIDLDAPVQRYLPWFRVDDPDASVVTLFRSGREGSCQKRDPGPGMRGKPERHGRSARQVASRLRTHQEA